MANADLTMKLLINGPTKKVLFAEAGKEVVDFLFSLLAMPLATIVKLLKEDNMVGCIGKLYKSLQSLEEPYIKSKPCQSALLNPTVSSTTLLNSLLLPAAAPVAAPGATSTQYYRCGNTSVFDCSYHDYIAEVSGTLCPDCFGSMRVEVTYVGTKPVNVAATTTVSDRGCVKGVVTYTIMDDLTVSPLSSISSITLLNKFKVKDLSSLEEKTVVLSLEKGLELLKASLQSKTVLTDTFMEPLLVKLEVN